jgi:hypothetical protein
MQDAPIDAATLYRADNVFGPDGATPDKTGQALIALGQLKGTPTRLQVVGSDADGFAIVAGRSLDSRVVRILISNYQIPPELLGRRKGDDILHVPPLFDVTLLPRRTIDYHDNGGFDLTVQHLASDRSYVMERCRITETDDFHPVRKVIAAGAAVHFTEQLPPPGVELITLRAAEPHEKPVLGNSSQCDAQ